MKTLGHLNLKDMDQASEFQFCGILYESSSPHTVKLGQISNPL